MTETETPTTVRTRLHADGERFDLACGARITRLDGLLDELGITGPRKAYDHGQFGGPARPTSTAVQCWPA